MFGLSSVPQGMAVALDGGVNRPGVRAYTHETFGHAGQHSRLGYFVLRLPSGLRRPSSYFSDDWRAYRDHLASWNTRWRRYIGRPAQDGADFRLGRTVDRSDQPAVRVGASSGTVRVHQLQVYGAKT